MNSNSQNDYSPLEPYFELLEDLCSNPRYSGLEELETILESHPFKVKYTEILQGLLTAAAYVYKFDRAKVVDEYEHFLSNSKDIVYPYALLSDFCEYLEMKKNHLARPR